MLIVPQEREEARREEEGRKKKLAAIFKTVNIDQFHLFFKYIKHKYIVINIYIYTRNLFCTGSIKTLSLTINLKT